MGDRGRHGQGFTKVKNRAPAPIQITAEQIVREAKERVGNEVKVGE